MVDSHTPSAASSTIQSWGCSKMKLPSRLFTNGSQRGCRNSLIGMSCSALPKTKGDMWCSGHSTPKRCCAPRP